MLLQSCPGSLSIASAVRPVAVIVLDLCARKKIPLDFPAMPNAAAHAIALLQSVQTDGDDDYDDIIAAAAAAAG